MNYIDKDKIGMFTGLAIQDDETFKTEGGFVPERDQYYFEVKQGKDTIFIGVKDLLECLKLLEELEEIPKIDEKWWLQMAGLYGNDILDICPIKFESHDECEVIL